MNLIAFALGLVRGFLRNVPVGKMFRRDFRWAPFFHTLRLRLRSIFRKKFRWISLLFISVLAGTLRATPWLKNSMGESGWHASLIVFLAVVEYLLMLAFLFRNRKKPGMLALITGTLLNGAVIGVNGGMMPVGPFATRFGRAVLERIHEAPHYFLAAGGEPLLFLADLIPFWSFGWFMISIGDLLIMIGIFRLAAYLPRRIIRPKPKSVD